MLAFACMARSVASIWKFVKVKGMTTHISHSRSGPPTGGHATKAAPGRFAAFGNRNFRLYFIGQTISSIGSWAQSLAVTWLVLELTNRSDQLGIALALQFLPMLILGAPAGVLADRLNNQRILLVTSALSGVLALTFGIVVTTGHATIWWIYALTFLLGLVLAVERPTMQAILFQLVGRDLLPNAVAVNGTINSVSRLIGPAVAGGLIATVGVPVGFYINAVSYLIVIAALLALRSSELIARTNVGQTKRTLREGFAYVRGHPEVARPLIVMSIVGVVALNFPTTFPSMVRFGFHRGAGSVGVAMSMSAIGSILGGVYVAGIKPGAHRTLAIALTGFGAAIVALGVMPSYATFLAMSIVLGFASASFQSINTVVVQQATEPAMQGRVMALHQTALFGSTPIGALSMGWVIHMSLPRLPFLLGGIAAVLCAAFVIASPSRRVAVATA
jgi:MFS family permease